MKKVALCFSGQCRYLERFRENFNSNFIEPLSQFSDIHIFYHFWREGTDSRGINFSPLSIPLVNNTLNPSDFIVDDQIPFPSVAPNPHTASMFYSIRQANSLKKQFEDENYMKFDIVARMRIDLPIKEKFNTEVLADIDDNIYVRPFHKDVTHDIFAIGNSDNMDIYSRCYDAIARGEYSNLLGDPERLLNQYLKDQGLSWKSLGTSFM